MPSVLFLYVPLLPSSSLCIALFVATSALFHVALPAHVAICVIASVL